MKPDLPHVVEPNDAFDRVNDYFYERGWTDGLPIVPPTASRVQAMLAAMPSHKAEALIAVVPPRMGSATMRQIAVNAVMAGCKPEYLPVVVAALQAVSEPDYGLSHRQTTTHAGAPSSSSTVPSLSGCASTAGAVRSGRAGAPTPRSGGRCGSCS